MKILLSRPLYIKYKHIIKEILNSELFEKDFVIEMQELDQERVSLPNFNDWFTKQYFSGRIRTFMPPQFDSHPYTNLLTVELEHPFSFRANFSNNIKDFIISMKEFSKLFMTRKGKNEIMTLCFEQIVIYIPITSAFHLRPTEFSKLIYELHSASTKNLSNWIPGLLIRYYFYYDGDDCYFIRKIKVLDE